MRPELVCEVEFSGLANHAVLRQAAFKGMRTDKPAPYVQLVDKDAVLHRPVQPGARGEACELHRHADHAFVEHDHHHVH